MNGTQMLWKQLNTGLLEDSFDMPSVQSPRQPLEGSSLIDTCRRCQDLLLRLNRYIAFKLKLAEILSRVIGFYGKGFMLEDSSIISFKEQRKHSDMLRKAIGWQNELLRVLSSLSRKIEPKKLDRQSYALLKGFEDSRAFYREQRPRGFELPMFKEKNEIFAQALKGLTIQDLLQLQIRAISEVRFDSVKKFPLIVREEEIAWRSSLEGSWGIQQITSMLSSYQRYMQGDLRERAYRLFSNVPCSFVRYAAGIALSLEVLFNSGCGIQSGPQQPSEIEKVEPSHQQGSTGLMKIEKDQSSLPSMQALGPQAYTGCLIYYAKEKRYLKPQELFEILKNQPDENVPVKATKFFPSNSPYARLILILEDVHISGDEIFHARGIDDIKLFSQYLDETAEDDFRELEHLRNEFGINFVGLEGWDGDEANKSRGFKLLCGQDDLILKCLEPEIRKDYDFIPLEIPKIHEIAFKIVTGQRYILLRVFMPYMDALKIRKEVFSRLPPSNQLESLKLDKAIKAINDQIKKSLGFIREDLLRLKIISEAEKENFSKVAQGGIDAYNDCSRFANLEKQIMKLKGTEAEAYRSVPNESEIQEHISKGLEIKKNELKVFFKDALGIDVDLNPEKMKELDEQWEKERGKWNDYLEWDARAEHFSRFFDEVIINRRNEIAAKLMVEGMKGKTDKGIIFFGKYHTPGLVNELQKLGNFHIIVAH